VQVVLVPLLAYDGKGNRLGFGKGHYDTFLGSLPHSVIKIGLSFFPPEDTLPVEPHDIPLNYCITPEQVWAFST
jgi:5-formyltetrahydrofolate cyclo-ligase